MSWSMAKLGEKVPICLKNGRKTNLWFHMYKIFQPSRAEITKLGGVYYQVMRMTVHMTRISILKPLKTFTLSK